MTPYLEGGLTIFVSEEGDAIAFDGWAIRSLGGFGEAKIVSVVDTEQYRVYRSVARWLRVSRFARFGPVLQ